MLLYVYRLRHRGSRRSAGELRNSPHALLDVQLEPWHFLRWGEVVMLAHAYWPSGKRESAIPMMEYARIRIRRRLLVTGIEVRARGIKSKAERDKQAWLCSPEPVMAHEWRRPPHTGMFEDMDDDEPDDLQPEPE